MGKGGIVHSRDISSDGGTCICGCRSITDFILTFLLANLLWVSYIDLEHKVHRNLKHLRVLAVGLQQDRENVEHTTLAFPS